jgi:hypothetical protein
MVCKQEQNGSKRFANGRVYKGVANGLQGTKKDYFGTK